MAIMLPNKDKKKALAQISEVGSLIVEKTVYLDSDNNVVEITELRRKAIELEKYKKYTKLTVIIAVITLTVAGVLLWTI
jgi:hypothetical protein